MQIFESVDPRFLLSGLMAYMILFVILLYVYFRRNNSEDKDEDESVAYNLHRETSKSTSGQSQTYTVDASPVLDSTLTSNTEVDEGGIPGELLKELETMFSSEKDPIWVTDRDYRVVWGNQSALRDFSIREKELREGLPLGEVLGFSPEDWTFSSKGENGSTLEKVGQLPNGEVVRMGMRFSLLNRLPKVYAVRIYNFTREEEVVAGAPAIHPTTDLTRGRSLDYREVDPDSVELSADQMLEPLREIDRLLTKVGPGENLDSGVVLRTARGKVRRMIHQIEEMDWMLQVNAGQLHLNRETFNALQIVRDLLQAANRLTGDTVAPAELDSGDVNSETELYSGDRRIYEKILTQLMTTAFRSGSNGSVRIHYRSTPVESPVHSDDWHLFVGEDEGGDAPLSREAYVEIVIEFGGMATLETSDLPTVVETLGSQILDPRAVRRLDFVKKGRDSDLFGLTLARELVGQLKGKLHFETPNSMISRFRLTLLLERSQEGGVGASSV